MPQTNRLFKIAFSSLAVPLLCYVASLGTGGFGPCGSMAGFYCFYAMLATAAVSGVLMVVAVASSIARRIP